MGSNQLVSNLLDNSLDSVPKATQLHISSKAKCKQDLFMAKESNRDQSVQANRKVRSRAAISVVNSRDSYLEYSLAKDRSQSVR